MKLFNVDESAQIGLIGAGAENEVVTKEQGFGNKFKRKGYGDKVKSWQFEDKTNE